MEKEIWEQLEAIRRAMAISQKEIAILARIMREARRSFPIGERTTYYVAQYGQYLLASLAGEFAPALSSDKVGVLVLMDRETFDTLEALRHARDMRARTAAIVNAPGSSMTREV
jgi:glucosamine 6-phosphate synthetase-like amidotransferase/phosphosugar isomerase protein